MKTSIAFGVGAAIGAGIVVLCAPKLRERVRGSWVDKASGDIERGHAKVREITSEVMRIADQTKAQVQRIQEAVDAGFRAVDAGVRAFKAKAPGQSELLT